ncbi:MAG: ceramide glucosyltransferase [Paracoccaceae bacterium]
MSGWMILPELFASAGLAAQLLSVIAVRHRIRSAPKTMPAPDLPPISVLRPVCGLENNLETTLRSTFHLTGRDVQILFCAACPDDPAVPLVEQLIAEYPQASARLLIGDDRISGNPKLNNLVKGWAAASNDWIVMADSNLLLPRDYLQELFACWTPGTGLVSSPAFGARPGNLWAAVEAAFLNTYQGRWQLLADELGIGFAQGKTLLWRRDILEASGGLAALGREMAEDVAATKLVRRAGLKVRVARVPFAHPLGMRTAREVWQRQCRWARVRRLGFARVYPAEVLGGAAMPAAVLAIAAALGWISTAVVPVFFFAWYAGEFALARSAGWPSSGRDILAWMVRDLMLPVLWIAGWFGSGFTWRGTAMGPRPTESKARP